MQGGSAPLATPRRRNLLRRFRHFFFCHFLKICHFCFYPDLPQKTWEEPCISVTACTWLGANKSCKLRKRTVNTWYADYSISCYHKFLSDFFLFILSSFLVIRGDNGFQPGGAARFVRYTHKSRNRNKKF